MFLTIQTIRVYQELENIIYVSILVQKDKSYTFYSEI